MGNDCLFRTNIANPPLFAYIRIAKSFLYLSLETT